MISNNAILSFHNVPFRKMVLKTSILHDLVYESFFNNIIIVFDLEYSFLSQNRVQPFKFKLIPIQNEGMVFYFNTATEDIHEKSLFTKENFSTLVEKFLKIKKKKIQLEIENFELKNSIKFHIGALILRNNGEIVPKSYLLKLNQDYIQEFNTDKIRNILETNNFFKKEIETKFYQYDTTNETISYLMSEELQITKENSLICCIIYENSNQVTKEIKDLAITRNTFEIFKTFIKEEQDLLSSMSQYIISDLIPIFKSSNLSYIIIKDDYQILDYNLPKDYSKLIDENNKFSSLFEYNEREYFKKIISYIFEGKLSNVLVSTNIFSVEKKNFTLIDYKIVLNFKNYLLLVLNNVNNNINTKDTFSDSIKPELLYFIPSNLSLDQIQKKIQRYYPGFQTIFERFARHNHYVELEVLHEDLLKSVEKKQFDSIHFLKFYLALTLNSPSFKISRKDLLYLLVDSNMVSYSIFSKIFPSIPNNEDYIIYNLDGNILLNENVRLSFIDMLGQSMGLLNENSIFIKEDEYVLDLDYDIVVDIKKYYNDKSISILKRNILISEKLTKVLAIIRKFSSQPEQKNLTILAKELPWSIGFTIGSHLRPFHVSYIPLNRINKKYFVKNELESKIDPFFIEQIFPEGNSTELIIVLNLIGVITPKVKEYLKENNIEAPILNYYLKDQLDFGNYFSEKNINSLIIEDLDNKIKEIESEYALQKIRIFCDIHFSLGLLLGNTDFKISGELLYYVYDSTESKFILQIQ